MPTAADTAIINTGGTAVIQPPTAAEVDELWVAVHTDSRVDVANATLDAEMVSLATQSSGTGRMQVSGPAA